MTIEQKEGLDAGLSELEAVLAEHAGTYLPKTKN